MERLFSEFAPATADDWKNQIIKDLKGGDFGKLTWANPNGFTVQPFYTAESLRRETQPLFTHTGWEVTEEIVVKNAMEANAKALKALSGGASSLHFVLGPDTDLASLLQGISVAHIELCFILNKPDLHFAERLASYLDAQGIDSGSLNGAICYDGVARLASSGSWFRSEEADMRWNNTWVDASLYQEAGATQSFELACALAHAHEYLLRGKTKEKFRFTLAIGTDFFGEIAKLRALRKLWRLLADEYRANPAIAIHGRSSGLGQAAADAYNNMLRTTTEGMSAVLGGCNSVTLDAYNKSFENTSATSERIARNQQLILREESYFDKVADAGAGSYYIEELTDRIGELAWEEFKEIEKRGGFIACLRSNYIQDRIREQAEKLITGFREEKVVLVGVNKYQNKSEEKRKPAPNIKRIVTGAEVMPIARIRLSDYLVKENA